MTGYEAPRAGTRDQGAQQAGSTLMCSVGRRHKLRPHRALGPRPSHDGQCRVGSSKSEGTPIYLRYQPRLQIIIVDHCQMMLGFQGACDEPPPNAYNSRDLNNEGRAWDPIAWSDEHVSELQTPSALCCGLLCNL